MKTKSTLFRRGEMFYMQDSATGKQTSLHTKDETEAKSLLEARNAAQRQPVLNLHLARAYLTASDPAFVERTAQARAKGRYLWTPFACTDVERCDHNRAWTKLFSRRAPFRHFTV